MHYQDIFVLLFLSMVSSVLGFKFLHIDRLTHSTEILRRIKDEIQNDFNTPAQLETHYYPPCLQFSMSDDINEVVFFVQEILKGLDYFVSNLSVDTTLDSANFLAKSNGKEVSFRFSIICTNFARSARGKNTYRMYCSRK